MNPLEQRVQNLENIIRELVKSDRIMFEKHVQFRDGAHIQVGRANGTKIGLSSSEKLGFFGATPIGPQTIPFPVVAADLYTALAAFGFVTH